MTLIDAVAVFVLVAIVNAFVAVIALNVVLMTLIDVVVGFVKSRVVVLLIDVVADFVQNPIVVVVMIIDLVVVAVAAAATEVGMISILKKYFLFIPLQLLNKIIYLTKE